MNAAVCVHHIADLSDLQRKRRIFERLLHLSRSEYAQVTSLSSRAAIRMLLSELCELFRGSVDLGLVFS